MVLQIRADPMYAYDFCSFPSFWHILWHFPYLFAALWHFPVFIATSFACSSPRTASEESKMRKGSIKLLLFHLLLLTAATKKLKRKCTQQQNEWNCLYRIFKVSNPPTLELLRGHSACDPWSACASLLFDSGAQRGANAKVMMNIYVCIYISSHSCVSRTDLDKPEIANRIRVHTFNQQLSGCNLHRSCWMLYIDGI